MQLIRNFENEDYTGRIARLSSIVKFKKLQVARDERDELIPTFEMHEKICELSRRFSSIKKKDCICFCVLPKDAWQAQRAPTTVT